jgi:hypothetical protein
VTESSLGIIHNFLKIWEILGNFGQIWEYLGKVGKVHLGDISVSEESRDCAPARYFIHGAKNIHLES